MRSPRSATGREGDGPTDNSLLPQAPTGQGAVGMRRTALVLGGGRVALGLGFGLRPVDSVRFLGVDTATANRMARSLGRPLP